MPALLAVERLAVHHRRAGAAPVAALDDATLEVAEGETVGVLGESGAGKSTLVDAILDLLPPHAVVAGGVIRFRGRDVAGLSAGERRALRGREIGLVPQDPAVALNPVRRVGPQVAEIVATHRPAARAACRAQAESALESVGLARETYDAYPHELSGGQRQRVTVAQALCARPALLLADEPTAALDSATQAELRGLLRAVQREQGLAMLLVSHDLGTVRALADRVVVLHAGRTIEAGAADEVLRRPRHPRTRELLAAVPRAPLGGSPALGR